MLGQQNAFHLDIKRAVYVSCIALLLVGLAIAGSEQPLIGVGSAVVILVGIAWMRFGKALAVGVFATVCLLFRVGGGADISVSDMVQALALVAIIPFLPGFGRNIRFFLGPVVVYLCVALLPVLTTPTPMVAFEWVHRVVIVLGGLLVGWFVGRIGYARAAVLTFLGAAVVMAVLAIETSATHGFGPAFIGGGMQKNTIGSFFFSAVFMVHVRPSWLRLKPKVALAIECILLAGLAASQSRGAIIALALALGLAAFLYPEIRRRTAMLTGIVALPAAFVIYKSFVADAADAAVNSLGTVAPRLAFREAALNIWRRNPIFGAGYKIFRVPGSGLINDPHNVAVLTLAESGLVGLLALVGLIASLCKRALTRTPREAAVVILGLIIGRAVHGMVDVYWVGGTLTVTWMLVGVVIGRLDRLAVPSGTIDLSQSAEGSLAPQQNLIAVKH